MKTAILPAFALSLHCGMARGQDVTPEVLQDCWSGYGMSLPIKRGTLPQVAKHALSTTPKGNRMLYVTLTYQSKFGGPNPQVIVWCYLRPDGTVDKDLTAPLWLEFLQKQPR
jgi:hypothetical protein